MSTSVLLVQHQLALCLLPFLCHTGPGQEEEEQGQERTHHHDGRLLSGRLEHEQEKALR